MNHILTRKHAVLGIAAALSTVITWTTWIIVSRFAMRGSQSLDPILLSFIRFGTGAILLSPIWIKFRLLPKHSPRLALAGLLCAGLPYQFLVLSGLHFAPATIAGPLLTGTLPLFVAILSVVIFREHLTATRIAGTLLISSGVIVIMGHELFTSQAGAWRGGLLLLLASLSWSLYTISFKKSGLTGFQATAFVALWSTLALVSFSGFHIVNSWHQTNGKDILTQIFVQGVMAGIVALITFTVAIKYIGHTYTTVITALTPVIVNIISVGVLGEVSQTSTIIGCLCIVLGVLVSGGVYKLAIRSISRRVTV